MLLKPTLLAFLLGATLISCSENTEPTAQGPDVETYPNEWMYLQRAYPDNLINAKAMDAAVEQYQEALVNKAATGTDLWTLKGPLNTGGRITDAAISPDSDDIMYITTAVGGVFKTVDGGANWTPIFDVIGKPSIGSIAIAPSDASRVYVGTGEANASATSGAFFGDGIYRSSDSGDNWESIGPENTDHIGRIVVDPSNPDRIFAAATGKLYGYNSERGIYRSLNAGDTWEKVLFVTDSTAAIDVAMNPVNTDILYAAMWERTRKPWQRDYAGVTSGIHRSTDGGDTWELLSNGLPATSTETGRIGLSISASDPNVIYASYTTNPITNNFDGLYKSEDAGDTWSLVALDDISFINASFGWYFGNLRVSPTDPDQVYVLGQRLFRTNNSGADWNEVFGMHVDHHAMAFSTSNPNFILAGNDGGAYTSSDGGNTWNKFLNLPITQFYNIEVDFTDPTRLYGGTQDNNTIRTLTDGDSDWTPIWGGDGFHCNVDPNNNLLVYAESQFGGLGRSTDGGFTFVSATAGISPSDRRNWNTPVVLSPFDSNKVYYGANRLYISDNAVSWSPISPDLTDGEHPSGAFSYGTLTAIAPSYNNLDVIYTGSDDGNVYITTDGGANWELINDGLPNRYVTAIAIDPDDDMTAYVTFSGFSLLDYDPHVFKTTDGGQNWTNISSNLPSIPTNEIVIYNEANVLFVGTDAGVWYSQNDGASWEVLGTNLPPTIIRDLKLHVPTSRLFVGTFGRSMYSYDLDQLVLSSPDEALEAQVILYPNPASTAVELRLPSSAKVQGQIYDLNGRVVKSFEQLPQNGIVQVGIDDVQVGQYIVKLQQDGKTASKQLLVQR